jgi:hypothetical protein
MYEIGVKLGVKELFYTHVGRYIGNGMVFHNHWKNGSEVISLQQFSNGKKVFILDRGVKNIYLFNNRVQELISKNKAYNIINNNCEHAASYVSDGNAKSPQLALYSLLVALAFSGLVRYSK